MSILTFPGTPLEGTSAPAERLRRLAAAVKVHFTWWGVHRTLTNEQKEEVSQACGADLKLVTAGKKIIDVKHEAFRRLTSLRSRIALYWRGLTLPYVEAGIRLIKQGDIEAFCHTMEGFRTDLHEAETRLNDLYEAMKNDARERLGRLYNANDYPPEVKGLFDVAWEFPSVEPPSYLMRLSPDLYRQEQERVARRFEEAVQLAEQAFAAEFAKLVSHLTERLSADRPGERKVFRDTAVTNLVEFFEKFRQLNVRSNPQLDELVNQAQQVVRGVNVNQLRASGELRQQVATQLAGVQAALDGMMVDRPRRRILRPLTGEGGRATAD